MLRLDYAWKDDRLIGGSVMVTLVGCVRLWAMSVILLGVTNAVLGLVGLKH